MWLCVHKWMWQARAVQFDEARNNLKEALELFFETASSEELSTRSFLERKSAGFLRFTDLKR